MTDYGIRDRSSTLSYISDIISGTRKRDKEKLIFCPVLLVFECFIILSMTISFRSEVARKRDKKMIFCPALVSRLLHDSVRYS